MAEGTRASEAVSKCERGISTASHTGQESGPLSQTVAAPGQKCLLLRPRSFQSRSGAGQHHHCPLRGTHLMRGLHKEGDRSVLLLRPILSPTSRQTQPGGFQRAAVLQNNSLFSLKCFVRSWTNSKWSHELQHTILSKYISPEIGSSQLCNFSCCCNEEHAER